MNDSPRSISVAAAVVAAVLTLKGCGGGSPDDNAAAGGAVAKPPSTTLQASSVVARPPAEVRPADDLGEVRRELAALRRDVGELQQTLRRTTAPSNEPARRTQPLPPAQSDAERLAHNEAAFRREPLDSTWGRQAELRIRAAITRLGNGAADRLRGLECRSRTCRVEIASDEFHSAGEALPDIATQLGEAFAGAETANLDQGDGRVAGLLFLTR